MFLLAFFYQPGYNEKKRFSDVRLKRYGRTMKTPFLFCCFMHKKSTKTQWRYVL